MKYRKIVFIGMMGAGKTTVAKSLAQKLKKSVLDLDALFTEKNKISIKDFFEKYGEEEFRKIESDILKKELEKDEYILSVGGGVILSEENRKLLFQDDILTIYLSAQTDTIYDRIKNNKTRPLLLVENPKMQIEKILNKREKYYLMAKKTIITDKKTPDEIVEELKWII